MSCFCVVLKCSNTNHRYRIWCISPPCLPHSAFSVGTAIIPLKRSPTALHSPDLNVIEGLWSELRSESFPQGCYGLTVTERKRWATQFSRKFSVERARKYIESGITKMPMLKAVNYWSIGKWGINVLITEQFYVVLITVLRRLSSSSVVICWFYVNHCNLRQLVMLDPVQALPPNLRTKVVIC